MSDHLIQHRGFLIDTPVGNMKKLFTEAEESMDELRDGANTVRTTVADDGSVLTVYRMGLY